MNTLINFIGGLSNAELAALTLALGAAFIAAVFFALCLLTGAGRASDEAEDEAALERKYGPLK